MAKKLPEITLTVCGYEWGQPYGTTPQTVERARADWRDDVSRYHVWLTRNVSDGPWLVGSSTIYKNDLQVETRRATRCLSPNAAANRAVYAEVLRLANETSLLQDDAARRYAEGLREIAEKRHKDAAAVREAFNRALTDSFAAGEINRSKFVDLVDLAADLPDESWLTLARAVGKA